MLTQEERRQRHNVRSNRIQKRLRAAGSQKMKATERRYRESAKFKETYEASAERRRETNRLWRQAHPEKYDYKNNGAYREQRLEISTRWRTNNPIKALIISAKSRAKRKGIPFDLTVDDLVMPTHCPITGVEMTPCGVKLPTSPSLDNPPVHRLTR